MPPSSPPTVKAELLDSRRLTGANLYGSKPGAVIDIAIEGDADDLIRQWAAAARELLDATHHGNERVHFRKFSGGASLLISAPIDALYSMCELNERAWRRAVACGGETSPDSEEELAGLKKLFVEERRPALLQLQQAAADHGKPFLWDDDVISVGYGKTCQVWPYEAIPAPAELDWDGIGSVPLALVTGTNGKSTSVRMAAAIMSAAGVNGGLTSTDFIRVGAEVIETGDYSGTGGARRLLRHPGVEMAVLEVARGGLLRRGLAVEQADAALITNVAADHLGEYGIHTVAELIEAKFIVRRALSRQSPLILNADDNGVADYAEGLENTVWWFSMDAENPRVRDNLGRGLGVCYVRDGTLFSNAVRGGRNANDREIIPVDEISSSRNGIVRHNIRNAMGSALLAIALGLPDSSVRQGLRDFRGDESDNPGRGNWFEGRGVRIIVDFAHNEHGVQSLATTVAALQATRVVLMMGQAGDRNDEAIIDLTRAGCAMQPDRLLVCEMPGYERGRMPGEVPELIRKAAVESGMSEVRINTFANPLAAARDALAGARHGDVLVFLALTQRQEILQLVHEYIDG